MRHQCHVNESSVSRTALCSPQAALLTLHPQPAEGGYSYGYNENEERGEGGWDGDLTQALTKTRHE